jgi:hypothetical protein
MGYVPTAPYCTDEEVQKLRDLWRPVIQANYQPIYEWDSDAGEGVWRPDDYDSTQTSLWADHPMYVIPPAIAEPLRDIIDNNPNKEALFTQIGSVEYALLHGAKRFVQRFVNTNYLRFSQKSPEEGFSTIHERWGSTNFTPEEVVGSDFDDPNKKALPHIDVNAPHMERTFDYEEVRIPRYKSWRGTSEGEDPYELVTERKRREGLIGWTVPRREKITNAPVFSLLLAKNHLVTVSWYDEPAERLSFTFPWPQLTKTGDATVRAAIAELDS